MEDFHICILKSKDLPYGTSCKRCGTSKSFKHGLVCLQHCHRILDDSSAELGAGGLPAVLQIFRITEDCDELGVSAKIGIPESTIFGPLTGLVTDFNGDPDGFSRWLLESDLREALHGFGGMSDESCSWMKFVRAADTIEEENLIACQEDKKVYFFSIKAIPEGHELRVRHTGRCSQVELTAPGCTSDGLAAGWTISNAGPVSPSGNEAVEMPRRSGRQKRKQSGDVATAEFSATPDATLWKSEHCPKSTVAKESSEESIPSSTDPANGLPVGKKARGGPRRKKPRDKKTIARSFRGVKRQNHVANLEDKLEIVIEVNPYQHTEWQASYGCWKSAFDRMVEAGLVEEQSEGPHRLKSLVNRHVDAYKTRMEKLAQQRGNEPEYLCPVARKDHLLQRILEMTGQSVSLYKCSDCSTEFPRGDLLQLHRLAHRNEALNPVAATFLCPSCGLEQDSLVALAEHVVTHSILEPTVTDSSTDFPCPKCRQRFGKEKYLARHLERMHPPDREKFDCPECPRQFDSLATMRKHNTRCHGTKKVVSCPVCLEAQPDFATLQLHTEQHRGQDGQYPCQQCPGKCYKDFKLLRKHIRTNHGGSQFACPVCDKVFKRRPALLIHQVVHSAAFEFECQTCGRKFKRREKLRDHMKRLHNPSREYRFKDRSENIARAYAAAVVCVFCSKQYANEQRLLQHQQLRHPDELNAELAVVESLKEEDDGGDDCLEDVGDEQEEVREEESEDMEMEE